MVACYKAIYMLGILIERRHRISICKKALLPFIIMGLCGIKERCTRCWKDPWAIIMWRHPLLTAGGKK